jgi:DNA repair protein SbcC/Rad50
MDTSLTVETMVVYPSVAPALCRSVIANTMMLSRWFKFKWPPGSPDTPRRAVHPPSADAARHHRQALESADPAARRAALAGITELELLYRTSLDDPDAGVREYARARLRRLLGGELDGAPPLAERLALLEQAVDLPPELYEQLARQGHEPELRLAVLHRLGNETLCADLAINDPVARIRTDALERVRDPELLDRIARRSRKRDKQISRAARERHRALLAAERRQEEIAIICRTSEQLQWDGETGADTTRFVQMEQVWQSLAEHASPTQRERFQAVRERFAEHFRASAAARAARQNLCRQLETLLHAPSDESVDTEALNRLRVDWSRIAPPDDADARRQQRRFEQLLETLEQQLGERNRNRQQTARREALLTEAEQLRDRAGQVLDSELSELTRRWQHLPRPESPTLLEELQTRFDRLMDQLRQRLARQTERKEQESREIETALAELEQQLEAGELQHAIERQQHAEQLLKHNIGLSRHQMETFRQRLHACMPRIAELRDWRRWGTNRSRESLIEEVGKLIDSPLEPDELARQVQAARAAWKEMDATTGGAPRALWKQFDQSCERAYAPVRAAQQARAEERQQNLARREALCAELEQRLDELDQAEQPDWRALSRDLQRFQQRWRQLGPVERRQRRAVERRFQTVFDALLQQLRPHLEQELERRRNLIERARALAESEDTRAAVEEIKRLQAEWQPRIMASRREEQALWKAFRAACDSVFEHRQAERQALNEERQRNLEQARALIASIDALSDALAEHEPDEARRHFRALTERWSALGVLPRSAQPATERHFHDACERFELAVQQQHRAIERQRLMQLAERAALCARAEALLLENAPSSALLEELDAAWTRAPAMGEPLHTALEQRFRQTRMALDDTPEARRALLDRLRGMLPERRQLCLQLEIAAEVETPPEHARERMAYQVERLSESFNERGPHSSTGTDRAAALALIRDWYLHPAPPDPAGVDLEARAERALAALLD